jgi:hypothetical protein
MRRATLVYQVGIANVFADDEFRPGIPRRLLQSDYRTCEAFARGLIAAGIAVEVRHWDHTGDAAQWANQWNAGKGELWASGKRPPQQVP